MATKAEKHGAGQGGSIADASLMLELFASIGAVHFDLTYTDTDEQKRGFRPNQTLAQLKTSIPFLIPSSFQRRNNVIIRPRQPASVLLIQLDDLPPRALELITPLAFMTVATSPSGRQAWLAVKGVTGDPKDFARRVRKAAGADPSASGAVRLAGTANYKRKYEPNFPIIRIDTAAPGRIVAPDALKALGLVSPPEAPRLGPTARKTQRAGGSPRHWPSYQLCLDRAPKAHGGDRPDVSRVDFTWALTAIDWGWSAEDVATHLMTVSAKAREQGETYAQLTAANAAIAIRRRAQPGPSP